MKRLTPAALTVVMFGIVGLLVLGYFAKTLFAQKEKAPASTLRDVPMALTDIKVGTVITAEHLGVGRFDRTKLTPDVLLSNRAIVGHVVREPIKAALPITGRQLYPAGELPPLDIGPGMRAVSVEVGDGVAMVDGIIKPGETVDVLFTVQGGSSGSDTTYQGGLTMRLFEGVKVLAINRNFTQGRVDRGNNHVTLELTVAQTNIIVLAKDRGKLTLTYNPNGRSNGGLALSNDERVTLYELLGLEKSDPVKEPFTTEVFKGSARATNRFTDKGYRVDDSRSQIDANQNPQYQLPNSTIPSRGQSGMNAAPQINSGPNRTINQTEPVQDNQRTPRAAPTAHLLQPRN